MPRFGGQTGPEPCLRRLAAPEPRSHSAGPQADVHTAQFAQLLGRVIDDDGFDLLEAARLFALDPSEHSSRKLLDHELLEAGYDLDVVTMSQSGIVEAVIGSRPRRS